METLTHNATKKCGTTVTVTMYFTSFPTEIRHL